MRNPLALALRSMALATASLVASSGTILAHAGEPHADASSGGWAAVGWYGVAAVAVVVVMLGLSTRHRPAAPDAAPDHEESSGPRVSRQ